MDRFSTQPWTDFWLNLFSHVWPFFPFLKYVETPIFIGLSAKQNIFVAHPPKLGTLFANTIGLTEVVVCPFFLHFCFSFFVVSGSLGLFLKRMKNWTQHNQKEPRPQDATRKPHSLVYKKKQTQNNATSLFRLQTDNIRKKSKNKSIEHENQSTFPLIFGNFGFFQVTLFHVCKVVFCWQRYKIVFSAEHSF